MTIDDTIKTIIIGTALGIIIPVTFLFWKAPKPILTAPEKELITFSTTPLEMSPPKSHIVYSALENPVRVTTKMQAPFAGSGGKSTALTPMGTFSSGRNPSPAASRPILRNSFGSHPVVSMIYTEGPEKTAIIDGKVLHEGSVFASNRVVRIEKTRVLLRSAGRDIWLSIE
jgi:hypothetical protein